MSEDTAETNESDCPACNGSGEIGHRGYGGDPVNDYVTTCADCKGTGRQQ